MTGEYFQYNRKLKVLGIMLDTKGRTASATEAREHAGVPVWFACVSTLCCKWIPLASTLARLCATAEAALSLRDRRVVWRRCNKLEGRWDIVPRQRARGVIWHEWAPAAGAAKTIARRLGFPLWERRCNLVCTLGHVASAPPDHPVAINCRQSEAMRGIGATAAPIGTTA